MTTKPIIEIFDTPKAGIIPVYVEPNTGILYGVFMVPSDPRYGGTQLNIAKGEIDAGETAEEAAWREGAEELGLIKENCTTASSIGKWDWPVRHPKIKFEVFVTRVHDPKTWNTPHYETGAVHHISLTSFDIKGRTDQRDIVKSAALYLALFNSSIRAALLAEYERADSKAGC